MTAYGDVLNLSKDKQKQKRTIEKYIKHEKYVDSSKINDIALVFLDSPFKPTDTFSVIKVSDKDPVDDEPCQAGM